jgi:hypothetical protein
MIVNEREDAAALIAHEVGHLWSFLDGRNWSAQGPGPPDDPK